MSGFEAIVLGGSAGSIRVVSRLLAQLDFRGFDLPIIIALHRSASEDSKLREVFQNCTDRPVIEPKGIVKIEKGNVYLAPADLHLIVETDKTLNVVKSALMHYSRPSIDVLLFSAAETYKSSLLGILVSGANRDGALGMKIIKDNGGTTIVQDPAEATIEFMPNAAIELEAVDYILTIGQISNFLNTLNHDIEIGKPKDFLPVYKQNTSLS